MSPGVAITGSRAASEEQENNSTNLGVAVVLGSAPSQGSDCLLDGREVFALVCGARPRECVQSPPVTNTQWADYPLAEGCGKISAFKI